MRCNTKRRNGRAWSIASTATPRACSFWRATPAPPPRWRRRFAIRTPGRFIGLDALGSRLLGEIHVDAEGGKRAVTLYATIERAGDRAAWLALMPLTGRTHQLRVHCAAGLGTPIVGDGKYGRDGRLTGQNIAQRLHLHARRLVLPHPRAGILDVTAPLPRHMRETWAFFGFDPDAEIDPFPAHAGRL
jgi:hypothetical protein